MGAWRAAVSFGVTQRNRYTVSQWKAHNASLDGAYVYVCYSLGPTFALRDGCCPKAAACLGARGFDNMVEF
jgi:hypothetical protein